MLVHPELPTRGPPLAMVDQKFILRLRVDVRDPRGIILAPGVGVLLSVRRLGAHVMNCTVDFGGGVTGVFDPCWVTPLALSEAVVVPFKPRGTPRHAPSLAALCFAAGASTLPALAPC